MNYTKIKKDNYTLHIIDSNRFKEIHVVTYFTKQTNTDEVAFWNLLCPNLTYSCKKYNSKSKIATRGEELYGAKVSTSFGFNGNSQAFIVGLNMLNPKYTDEKYMEETLDFYYEILFNPNIENNGFNEEFFNITKKNYIKSIKSIKDNPADYGSLNFDRLFYKGTVVEKSVPTVEEIEKVNSKNLYKFYKKIFDGSYKIDVVVYGEETDNIVKNIENKYKSLKGNNDNITFDFKHNYNDEVEEVIDNTNFKQSRLYIGYVLKKLNYHEMNHVLRLYNIILGSMNDSMLFNYVREKYSLCYSIGSNFNRYDPCISIYAGINKSNYEETKKRIFETVEFMKDKNKLNRLFKQAKETFNTYINSYYDDLYSQINHYYFDEFKLVEDIEELRNNVNNVTIDEIISLGKKLELSTIYFMKGDE